ncbi:phosphocholine-specific phospholipase C [Lunatimonas lonarensis]|nr:phospholipase C, phosphocholine-specific [Lunatimonas lonarensis]
MKDSRRDFLKKAAVFTGGAGLWSSFPASIQKAMAINPETGSTFMDAEHIVVLMQENRSFDHCFGKLKGVRGFNDPRAIRLPNNNLVWMQSDKDGNTFSPFRFNIKDTKATWMKDIPHSWENQVDARNDGKYDGWIEAKRSGRKEFAHVPMTMGFYEREDIPFYYAFADAFTVCDQHFCSSLTGTTTNRNYHWTGKTHGKPGDKPKVRNSDIGYSKEVNWNTFPERLEDHGISWKVYQNEVSLTTELSGEEESLLANFTDNNLEWFTQFKVRFTPGHYAFLRKMEVQLPAEIQVAERQLQEAQGSSRVDLEKMLSEKREQLASVTEALKAWNPESFEKLSDREKSLHQRAFTVNNMDPDYHATETLTYEFEGEKREVKIPKGDIFHEFRKDVESGKLPTVSWLVAPQKFSDHPSAPWYGAWYVSEALDILTQDPEVWKKTIFILNYDENDGYFDHVPPFVPPKPGDLSTGRMSDGLDATGEYVTLQQELDTPGMKPENARESPVGLGYRVPLVVASPWSRGGWVNSEVCDITSVIQLMEVILSKKTGKEIKETNISEWRRAICGDLTSVFRPYNGETVEIPDLVNREEHVKSIYNASFKNIPDNFKALSKSEVGQLNVNPSLSPWMPRQEPGTKPSNALAYELNVDGRMDSMRKEMVVDFVASSRLFGKKALGAPFHAYVRNFEGRSGFEPLSVWSFAVKAGDGISYAWPLDRFPGKMYEIDVLGPNGFFRKLSGDANDPSLDVRASYERTNRFSSQGKVKLDLFNNGDRPLELLVKDNAYSLGSGNLVVAERSSGVLYIDLSKSHGWYDFSITAQGFDKFTRQYAGRAEFGFPSRTDPYMGGIDNLQMS